MIRKVVKITGIVFITGLALLIYSAFFIEPVTFKMNNTGGWSVGLIDLKPTETLSDVYKKSENNEIRWVTEDMVITDDSILFLADPFLVRHHDSTYLFVETQAHGRGAYITVFYIPKVGQPEYLGVALDEPFHLSYPQVVKLNQSYYMVPESQRGDSSFIYECIEMPLKWKRVGFVYPGRIKDPTLLPLSDSTGYLYYALKGKLFKQNYIFLDNLFHLEPKEYLKTGTCFRPGGMPSTINGQDYLFLQDNSKGYGTALYAYPIGEMGFINNDLEPLKILESSEVHMRFEAGMHHICVLSIDNQWTLVAIDGNRLVNNSLSLNLKFFIKQAYLKLWDRIFRNRVQPLYPFNE